MSLALRQTARNADALVKTQADTQRVVHSALESPAAAQLRPALRPVQRLAAPEFSFDSSDYQRVRRLIYEHAGISLSESKQAMVYSRLSRLLRDTGHANFNDYLQWLESEGAGKNSDRWQSFVNALTTNLTAFFREEHHFLDLEADLNERGSKPLRIWCNAASTGEEPYSIAMTVHEALGATARVSLLATDIDTNVLAAAQRGVYNMGARGLSPERMRRHFLKGKGDNSALMRIKPDLARGIEFRAHNLIHAQWSLGEPFDIVFCRNVMIYFDAATQHAVLERMHRVIKPGGLLYVGHSESFNDSKHLFRLRGKTIYERV
jgi:chemotaxis protein methyltransferase CheR